MFSTMLKSVRFASRIVNSQSKILARHPQSCRRLLCDKAATQPKDMVHVSDFDKKMLLKAKLYKTAEEIPEYVTPEKVKKARDYMRIRVNLYMVAATVAACVVMVISGRRARDSGDSLTKRGLEWQRSKREEGLKEEAEKKAAQEKAV